MKIRKKILSTLMGVALTSQMLPSTYTIVANAQTPSAVTAIEGQGQQQEQNKLSQNEITLLGCGCDYGAPHQFKISFDTNNSKLKATINPCYHGFHPYFGGEYINIRLIKNNGTETKELSLKGTDNVDKVKVLNEWDFSYGDQLLISHAEADWRVKIKGNVTGPNGEPVTNLTDRVSKDVLNTYSFKITKDGLQEVERTKISFSGRGCTEGTHQFDLYIDPKSSKLKVNIVSGLGGNHEFHSCFSGKYVGIDLVSSTGTVKKSFSLKGTDNVSKVRELNNWDFKYGDRLRLTHAESDWRVKIYGEVTDTNGKIIKGLNNRVSSSILNTYDFKITPNGLQEVKNNIVQVSNSKGLIDQLSDKHIKTVKLTKDITLSEDDISKLDTGFDGAKELRVAAGVTIDGNGHTINFNGHGSLTLAGNNITLINLTVKTCANVGMQIYNSRDVYLKNVTVRDALKYGLVVNASTVKLENCTTKNNTSGGLLISKSVALQGNEYTDSKVTVIGTLTQSESTGPKVTIKNFQVLEAEGSEMQNNTFIKGNNTYEESESTKTRLLEKVYCDKLGLEYGKTNVKEVTHIYN